jgi:hypothetical protein
VALVVTGLLAPRTGAEDKPPAPAPAPAPPPAASGAATGDAPSSPSAPTEGGPRKVIVGIFLNQIHGFSLRENKFEADFYIWFRWKGDDLNPLETLNLMNGRIDSKESVYESVREGERYSYCRIRATIITSFDVSRFPLDNHTITLEVEDNDLEDDKLVYLPDVENSDLSPSVQVPGWQVAGARPAVVRNIYKTNYGDIALPPDQPSYYSRFVYSVALERRGFSYFGKLFLGVFVTAALAFLALFIKPTNVDPRFGLGVGAMFAAVSLQYIISSSMPETAGVTLADQLHLVGFTYIFLSIAASTISLYLFENGHEDASRRLDRIAILGGVGTYVALNSFLVLRA